MQGLITVVVAHRGYGHYPNADQHKHRDKRHDNLCANGYQDVTSSDVFSFIDKLLIMMVEFEIKETLINVVEFFLCAKTQGRNCFIIRQEKYSGKTLRSALPGTEIKVWIVSGVIDAQLLRKSHTQNEAQ